MKKFFKLIGILILIVVLGGGGYMGYRQFTSSNEKTNAFALVPHDAAFVVETENLSTAWTQLSKSELWQYLKTTDYFADINEDLELVDKFLKDNVIADKLLSGRKLIVAGCLVPPDNWDMLFFVDLEAISAYFDDFKATLKHIDGFKYSSTKKQMVQSGENVEVHTLQSNDDPTFKISIMLINNVLVASLEPKLINSLLTNYQDGFWENNSNFQLVNSGLSSRNMFKMYVNWPQCPSLYKLFSTDDNEIVDMLATSLRYSALQMDLQNEQIDFSGYTSLDSIYSYVRAFSQVGPGKSRGQEIISNQTAAYISLGFNDFNRFYQGLLNEYERGNKKEMDEMKRLIAIAEKLLGISIQNDFLGWLGNEIAICKLRPLSESSRDIDIAAMFHAADINKAKQGLGNIVTHIKRRTPVKMEIEPYKNFEINYLGGVKGIFKMFLGKLFSQLEKPYFTYIEDYVVFANSQEVLHQIIDDYLQGRILAKDEKFADFRDEFDRKSNVAIYLQTPKLYEMLYKYAPVDEKKSIEENKDLICSFARFGFQLSNDNGLFKSNMLLQYDSLARQKDMEEFAEALIENETEFNIDSLKFIVTLPSDTTFADGKVKINYPDTARLNFEGAIMDERPEGIWRTYYKSGNLMATGNYDNGKLNGTFFFYKDARYQNQALAEVTYKNNVLHGNFKEYYPDGTLKSDIPYENGKINGVAYYYRQNGKLRLTQKYKNNQKSGKSTVYDVKGKKVGKTDSEV